MDTSVRTVATCDSLPSTQHWLAGAKYPAGSEVLATRANAWLQQRELVDTSVNGLISFRFFVDCQGRPSGFFCEQSTLEWKPTHFRDADVIPV